MGDKGDDRCGKRMEQQRTPPQRGPTQPSACLLDHERLAELTGLHNVVADPGIDNVRGHLNHVFFGGGVK